MIRHYLALITFSALCLASVCASPFYLYFYIAGGLQVAGLAAIGSLICAGVFCHAAEQASAKIVREKTRRNFIAG